jgi:hypothetical protein
MANGNHRPSTPGQVGQSSIKGLMGETRPKPFTPQFSSIAEALQAALAKIEPAAIHMDVDEPDTDVVDDGGSRLDRLRVALGSDVVDYFMESAAGKKLIEKCARATGDARDEARQKLARYVAVDLDKVSIFLRIESEIRAIDEDEDDE